MRTTGDLRRILRRIDGKGYKAYKEIEGAYDCGEHTLFLDHAQGDPFASPSLARVRVPQKVALLPRDTYSNKIREIALRTSLCFVVYPLSQLRTFHNKTLSHHVV